MKIGLVSSHSFLQPGGVKKHILGLAKEFKRRGIKVKIIIPRREESENYGKDVILLGTSFPIPFAGSQGDFTINFNPLAVRKVFKKEKFDVLHFHNLSFPATFQILELSKSLNILTFHANIEKSNFIKNFPTLFNFYKKIIESKIKGIIGVAPFNLDVFKDFKCPKAVIPNGIDLEEFFPQGPKIKKFLDGKINIFFLGRIEERKGLIYLLRAFKIINKKYPNVRLLIVGEGPLKDDCQEYVEKNGLTNVVFEKKIKEKDVPSYYRTCDIFCSPAIFGESFGIVLIEAMASGKPVVAFANKGYKIVLGRGRGKRFLAKPRDFRTLAKKLEVLIKNQKLRKEMGEWGIKEARKYSWEKIADKVLAFYELCRKIRKNQVS